MLTFHTPESWSYPLPCHGEGEKEPLPAKRAEHDVRERLDRPNLQTFSRRKKGKPTCAVPLCQSSSPTPVPDSSADSSGNDHFPTVVDDLDAPIAHRKGVRTCTQHPISQFVSYSRLSSSYRAFVSSLSSISIPQDWKEAIIIPEWKEAMVKEMTALKNNGTWELVTLPNEKKQWDVNGCSL